MSLFDVEHFRNDNKIDAWLQLTSDTHSNMWPVELWHYRWPRWTFKVILAIFSVKKCGLGLQPLINSGDLVKDDMPIDLEVTVEAHFKCYKQFRCLYMKYTFTNLQCTKSITMVGHHMWAVILPLYSIRMTVTWCWAWPVSDSYVSWWHLAYHLTFEHLQHLSTCLRNI